MAEAPISALTEIVELSYERFIQEELKSYKGWLEDMYLANCHERSEVGEPPFVSTQAYEIHYYEYLQTRYTNFCEAQYNLYINDGEMDIEITFFDD